MKTFLKMLVYQYRITDTVRPMKCVRILFLFGGLLAVTDVALSFPEDIRVRAREHFEAHRYKADGLGGDFEFRGLTNTINLWYEKPFHYSVGLAFGPVIGSAKAKDASTEFGETVKLWVAGVEAKYFPYSAEHLWFIRLGLSWHRLETDGRFNSVDGWGSYLGLGREFPIGMVSIAPEVAFRKVFLERGVEGDVVTPSIGFHFYPELRNKTH
jgi:hypothetical protein